MNSKSHSDGLYGFAIVTGSGTVRYVGWTDLGSEHDALSVMRDRTPIVVRSARQVISSIQQERDPRSGQPIGMSKFVIFMSLDMMTHPTDVVIIPNNIILIGDNHRSAAEMLELLKQAEDREAHAAEPPPDLDSQIVIPRLPTLPTRRH